MSNDSIRCLICRRLLARVGSDKKAEIKERGQIVARIESGEIYCKCGETYPYCSRPVHSDTAHILPDRDLSIQET